jgi:hypothetical protein
LAVAAGAGAVAVAMKARKRKEECVEDWSRRAVVAGERRRVKRRII